MKGCKDCPAYDKCNITYSGYRGSSCAALRWTYGVDSDPEIVTNADHIRTMTDEELAEYFADMAHEDIHDDPGAWLAWLQKPHKEDCP